jgi:plastocyanin
MPTTVLPSRADQAVVLPATLHTIAAPVRPRTATATVDIVRFTFSPEALEVPVGTTVTWVNHDESPHTATAEDGAFDTGSLHRGERAGVTFDAPGAHRYACAFNPGIVATIVVTPA